MDISNILFKLFIYKKGAKKAPFKLLNNSTNIKLINLILIKINLNTKN